MTPVVPMKHTSRSLGSPILTLNLATNLGLVKGTRAILTQIFAHGACLLQCLGFGCHARSLGLDD